MENLLDTFSLTVEPTERALSLEDAKTHLKVEHNDEDDYITLLIEAAQEVAEKYLQLKLVDCVGVQKISSFFISDTDYDFSIPLLINPVSEVISIKYLDESREEKVLSTDIYGVDLTSIIPCIYLKNNKTWPNTLKERNSISIELRVGYDDCTKVPKSIKAAMILMIANWYTKREDSVKRLPMQSEWLLNHYREFRF